MKALDGHILTPRGFIRGRIGIDGRLLASVVGEPVAEVAVRDSSLPIVLPGFVDLHVHGGGGADVMDGDDAALKVAQVHVQHGTTTMLATTMTAPADDLRVAFAGVAAARVATSCEAAAAHIHGVHLEGPFIGAGKLGAQPDFTRPISLAEVKALHAVAPITLISVAPEAAAGGEDSSISALVQAGFRVQLGHSGASYEAAKAALDAGATGFTHLYNAMSGLHHRQPGMVGAALAHASHAEVIPDLLHVHPGAIRVALRSIAGLYCVTDSTAAAGMPDGEYRLGRQLVTRCMGGVRLADGTLAGSTLTMDDALCNLINALGLSLTEASLRTSTLAADYIGATQRGRLVAGAFADMVVFDRDLQLRDVIAEGLSVHGRD
ncbi:N-acetylglucosamine-6-phosphate deacetylase [Casimicrobium huifangae]|uniref:N-acetylglucosamine-6-phosphate deacetylase n=1 Tax=Casimicrobium huifangae TaxID=2591109 RepID=UPI0012EBB4D7|nr:N-acetylglucosamine-6-phosphate deacetylase [Casimicrobium huifangae]